MTKYQDYLLTHWSAGGCEIKQLYAEIRLQGYTGSYPTVYRFLQCFPKPRKSPIAPRKLSIKLLPKVKKRLRLTPRRAVWMVLRETEKRTPRDAEVLEKLKLQNEALAEAIKLAELFAALVRQRQGEKLEEWLESAQNCQTSYLRRFAANLKNDFAAVKAAMTFSYSNGAVEGQVNRLKMFKRQMFGRAKVDLLTKRFLIPV